MTTRVTTNNRLLLLETEVRGIKDEQHRLSGVVETFIEEIQQWRQRLGRPNWPVIASLIGGALTFAGLAFAILVSGMSLLWFVITSQINGVVAPIRSDIAYVKSMSEANHDNIDRQLAINNEQEQKLINARNGLAEVETQFRANDEARNVQFAEQQRKNEDVQNALHDLKATYPAASSGPYYHPHIAKPHDKGPED